MTKKIVNYKVWTPARVEELERLIEHGASYSETAAELGVSRSAVAGKMRRLKRGAGNGVSVPRIDWDVVGPAIRGMIEDGNSCASVASELSIDEMTVRGYMKKHDIPLPGHRRRPPIDTWVTPVSFEGVANKVVAPGIEKHLMPLLHFRGAADLGRVHRLWNYTVTLKEHGIETRADAFEFGNHPKFSHLCEPPGVPQSTSLLGFWSRVLAKPLVCDLEPGLLDYVRMMCPRPISLTEVGAVTHHHGAAWWRTYQPRRLSKKELRDRAAARSARAAELVWPYIRHDHERPSDAGTDLVMAVNKVVSTRIPEESRADICQDLLMSILEGKWTLGDVQDNPKKYISEVRRMSPWKYDWVSMDAPIFGDGGRTLQEVIAG